MKEAGKNMVLVRDETAYYAAVALAASRHSTPHADGWSPPSKITSPQERRAGQRRLVELLPPLQPQSLGHLWSFPSSRVPFSGARGVGRLPDLKILERRAPDSTVDVLQQ